MTPSNTSDKSRALAFSLVALSLTVLATAGRLFSLLFFYDRIGYYQSGAILPIASNILFAASVVFFGVAALFLLKPAKTRRVMGQALPWSRVPSLRAPPMLVCR